MKQTVRNIIKVSEYFEKFVNKEKKQKNGYKEISLGHDEYTDYGTIKHHDWGTLIKNDEFYKMKCHYMGVQKEKNKPTTIGFMSMYNLPSICEELIEDEFDNLNSKPINKLLVKDTENTMSEYFEKIMFLCRKIEELTLTIGHSEEDWKVYKCDGFNCYSTFIEEERHRRTKVVFGDEEMVIMFGKNREDIVFKSYLNANEEYIDSILNNINI